jgi:hypothetical protein
MEGLIVWIICTPIVISITYPRKDKTMSSKKSSIIREAIKKQEEYIRNRNRDFKITKSLMRNFKDSGFPADTQIWVDSYSIQIIVPWGVRNMRMARLAVGKGWEFSWKSEDPDGSISYSYYQHVPTGKIDEWGNMEKTHINLNIRMNAQKLPEGTCQRILVHEEERTYKVQKFKIVCTEGTMQDVVRESEIEVFG